MSNNSTKGAVGHAKTKTPKLGASQIRDFYGLATSYWATGALLAAVRLNLFDSLQDEAREAKDIASELDLNTRWTAKLLEACAALGLVKKKGSKFVNTPMANALLVSSCPTYQGHFVKHLGEHWFKFGELDFTVRTGRRGPLAKAEQDSRTAEDERSINRTWVYGMHNLATGGQAEALAEVVNLKGKKQLLDVGCGSGTYSALFCERYPQLKAIAFDLPEIIEFAEDLISKSTAANRITLRSGDVLNELYGTNNDVVLFSGVLHGVDEVTCRKLLRRAYDSLTSGGLLIVQDLFLCEKEAGPIFPALFSLNMMVGVTYYPSEIKEWMEELGFKTPKLQSLPNGTWLDSVITATKK